MKYLIFFIVLATAIFITTIETKVEIRKKWRTYRCRRYSKRDDCPMKIVRKAIKIYNRDWSSTYKLKKIQDSEVTVERPRKIRVFYRACILAKKIKPNNKFADKMFRPKQNICRDFRATYQKIRGKPQILVRNLDDVSAPILPRKTTAALGKPQKTLTTNKPSKRIRSRNTTTTKRPSKTIKKRVKRSRKN